MLATMPWLCVITCLRKGACRYCCPATNMRCLPHCPLTELPVVFSGAVRDARGRQERSSEKT